MSAVFYRPQLTLMLLLDFSAVTIFYLQTSNKPLGIPVEAHTLPSWWRHDRVPGPLWGEPPVASRFPPQRSSDAALWCLLVYFDVNVNKLLNKQSRSRWAETSWGSSYFDEMQLLNVSVTHKLYIGVPYCTWFIWVVCLRETSDTILVQIYVSTHVYMFARGKYVSSYIHRCINTCYM